MTDVNEQPDGDGDGGGSRESMLSRMTSILDAFVDRGDHLRLDDIVNATGLPRSTSHRILDQLVRLAWLQHSADGYALGRRALQLGGAPGGLGGHEDLRGAAVPVLQELHARTGQLVQLGILDFAEVVYLDTVGYGQRLPAEPRVGGRVPAHCVALGKAMLAWLAPEEIDALLYEGLKARTRTTITDLSMMHVELRRIRSRHGIAFEHDENVPGVSSVGAAVQCPDGVTAGIALAGATADLSLERWVPVILDAARRISSSLCPDSPPDDMPSAAWSDGMMSTVFALTDDDAIM
ncbi:IclR family transcriptional regulator [Nocardioides albidus]|uniref:IclR family transcriptional regulator n=1 Tax=Nocardioides albidus TaxID=1517589 RepID=A0A5C4WRG4_9ACTN|nr:IclR family transcriptional regulator [Nocardioides albidus]TNM50848.1 IclR family transcriptional regulator [Nocardioides albidus]